MPIEARVAYINAQTACMLARLEAMKAENRMCEIAGRSPAYGETAFDHLPIEYGIHHNAVIGYLGE